MKLSVKWLAGLAVLALAVVAVVGSTSATKAATGSIFVANEWSKVTNESPAPSGYTTRSTVFGTYGKTGRIIETDADLVKIVVIDSELNEPTPTTASGAGEINVTGDTGSATNNIEAGPATPITITLTGAGVSAPIAGSLAQVQANTKIIGGTDGELNGTRLTITNFFSGSALGDPFITALVTVNITDQPITVTYDSASIGSATVTVKSELNATGVTLTATESGVGTGRFVGYVRLEDNTVTAVNGSPGDTPVSAAKIETNVGPVTASFIDSSGATRSTTVSIDTQAPIPSVTSPVEASATTNRKPTFAGTVSETGAGLDVSSIKVWVDQGNDQDNSTPVVTDLGPNGEILGSTAGVILGGALDLGVSTSGAVDGDTAFSFSDEPGSDLPTGVVDPDHIVDFVVKASDLAGNTGLSDSDQSTAEIDLPTVKIDQTDPNATSTAADHRTGLAWDGSMEVEAKNSLRLAFLDNLTNVQASDFAVTLDSGAVRTPSSVTVVNNASDFTLGVELLDPIVTGVNGVQSLVYLEFTDDLASNETPFVELQDIVSDLAGNFISEFIGFTDGEVDVQDGIAPTLTVTLGGGSGTGSGSEGSTGLTTDDMDITIVSDESLSQAPVVQVYRSGMTLDGPAPLALGQGSNTWVAKYSVPGSSPDGKRVIKITSIDLANNSGTTGSDDTTSTSAPNFRVDQTLAAATLKVGGGSSTTDQTRPSIIIDYAAGGEASTVTLSKVTLDGVDITADVVAASDGKRFFYIPPSDLSVGEHKLLIASGDAEDAAGNDRMDQSLTLTIEERATFNIDMFAGWNAVSFPSDPIDPDINSVFGNAGHDAVLGFDPSVPGGWRVAVRDTVSGMLEPASEGGLTTVRSTQAYWVHSNNFEQVEALLVGEVLPAAGSPPGIVSIPTVSGFNAVPIVDTSRKQTTGDAGSTLQRTPAGGGSVNVTVADYLGAVSEGRVYKWNSETLTFELASGTTGVNTGEVLFVEVTGTPTPIFP